MHRWTMATHLERPFDFEAEFSRRSARHGKQIKWSVAAAAVALLVALAMWAMFLRYV
jgi:hypothetical protein